MAITGAIRGTTSEKIFQELRLETLKLRRWLTKLCMFYKLIKERLPAYLLQLIPEHNTPYTRRSVQKSQTPFFKTKANFFKNSFFPAVIMEWNKIDVNICNSASCNDLKRVILNFIRPEPSQVFNFDSRERLKFLIRIRLGLSHLADHKFRCKFQDCVSPICSYGQETQTSTYFLLHCSNYHCARQTFFRKMNKTNSAILKQNDQVITKLLLFGNEKPKAAHNKFILTARFEFLQAAQRLKPSLFN